VGLVFGIAGTLAGASMIIFGGPSADPEAEATWFEVSPRGAGVRGRF
jgi:hypothetical protein